MKNTTKLTPYFTVQDADAFLEYMANVFGASVIKLTRHDDGKVQHARIIIDDSIIMLNEASEDYPAICSQMHIYVRSAQKTYEDAIQQGSSSIMRPMKRPHGDLMAGFKDPFGNTWWVAEPSFQ